MQQLRFYVHMYVPYDYPLDLCCSRCTLRVCLQLHWCVWCATAFDCSSASWAEETTVRHTAEQARGLVIGGSGRGPTRARRSGVQRGSSSQGGRPKEEGEADDEKIPRGMVE